MKSNAARKSMTESRRKLSATAHQAASLTTRDLAGWVPRRGLSADAEILPELSTLVSRASDADRNNGVARGGIDTIVDNVVGTGLRLSARPNYAVMGRDKNWAIKVGRDLEGRFHDYWWSTACSATDTMNGDQLTELELRTTLTRGDVVTLPLWLPERGDGYSTKLQLVEGDRLCNPNGMGDTRALRGGIQFDPYGMPLGYYFRAGYQADQYVDVATWTWEYVPRKTPFGRLRVIHDFHSDRIGQSRGKPLLTAVMAHFKQADRYIAAELIAAVNNGMITGSIETPLDQDHIVDLFSKNSDVYMKARAESAVRMEGGTLMPLMPGDKLEPFIPGRPNPSFGTFMENVFRIIAVGLGMPYELLLKDFSKTSYSSARASMLEAWRSFYRRRDRLGCAWLDPIYGLFAEEQISAGKIADITLAEFYANRQAFLRCRWIGPGKGWVDPVKEAAAAAARIEARISTLEDECAEQGRDWREVLEQQAVEEEEMARLKLAPRQTSVRVTGNDTTEQPPNPNDPNSPDNVGGQEQQQQGAGYEVTIGRAGMDSQTALLLAMMSKQQPAPQITVHPAAVTVNTPAVTVHPAAVTVHSPDVTVEPAAVNVNAHIDMQGVMNDVQTSMERGLDNIAGAVAQPVEPVYDSDGNLIGARRVKAIGDT